jgi:hypothetical protein
LLSAQLLFKAIITEPIIKAIEIDLKKKFPVAGFLLKYLNVK